MQRLNLFIILAGLVLLGMLGVLVYWNNQDNPEKKATPESQSQTEQEYNSQNSSGSDLNSYTKNKITGFVLNVPILNYHYIQNPPSQKDNLIVNLSVTPENFRTQMLYLVNNKIQTLTMQDLIDDLQNKKTLSNSVILTFDDGYSDFYASAFPVLKEYDLKATVFMITSKIGQPGYLTSAQIQELDQSGLVTIGSHTVDHISLKNQTKQKESFELEQSKLILEKKVGHKVDFFAYPNGIFDEQSEKIVEQTGYKAAVTTVDGSVNSYSNRFIWTRKRVGGRATLDDFIKIVKTKK
jgi:peptidoglycan/xylan/chitin deacetylase (PgdA/CDA1 family)